MREMETSDVFKILVARDGAVLARYVESMQAFLREIYGESLASLYPKLRSNPALAFLMVLNREGGLRAHILGAEGTLAAKHRAFFPTLRAITEDFLDQRISPEQYVERCSQAWVIS